MNDIRTPERLDFVKYPNVEILDKLYGGYGVGLKNIAVVCNNRQEWRHFVDTLQFTLSKENKPYKAVKESIVDIEKQVKYILVHNSYRGIDDMLGRKINDYLTMASIIDNDVYEYLMTNMRGE